MKHTEYAKLVIQVNKDKDSIVEKLQSGTTISELAKHYNCSAPLLSKLLNSLDIRVMQKRHELLPMQVNVRHLEKVVRHLCSQLNIEFDKV